MYTSSKIELDECIVAYFDFLGAKERMKESSEHSLNQILDIIKAMKIDMDKWKLVYNANDNFDMRIFSDNIVIAKSMKGIHKSRRIREIMAIFFYLRTFQIEAFKHGWLIRGGVTLGDFSTGLENIAWGSGLIRSYEIESKIAMFPRIVVDENIICDMKSNTAKESGIVEVFCKKDIDGMYFLKYLNNVLFDDDEEKRMDNFATYSKYFNVIKNSAIHNRKIDDNVSQKLFWLVNYINWELDNTNFEKQYRFSMD